MSAAAVLLALAAALLHAVWNAIVKDSDDPLLGVWSIIVVAAVAAATALPFVGPPEVEIVPLLVAAVVLGLARPRRVTDVSRRRAVCLTPTLVARHAHARCVSPAHADARSGGNH